MGFFKSVKCKIRPHSEDCEEYQHEKRMRKTEKEQTKANTEYTENREKWKKRHARETEYKTAQDNLASTKSMSEKYDTMDRPPEKPKKKRNLGRVFRPEKAGDERQDRNKGKKKKSRNWDALLGTGGSSGGRRKGRRGGGSRTRKQQSFDLGGRGTTNSQNWDALLGTGGSSGGRSSTRRKQPNYRSLLG